MISAILLRFFTPLGILSRSKLAIFGLGVHMTPAFFTGAAHHPSEIFGSVDLLLFG
ncbi:MULTISPECIES: hypothetical protein [unclassified Neorhizobium]|uniref:hypothetical protein n=1 Tax=unclassified Neorhizobium TaxID=2629175 RepID=UPI001FF2991E|nr:MULTISPECIES: hypothetical protein [unclassified Neorhizobium]MCJ9674246.1 hypothetical protein [Neorhizobium sp. SHOUNA12B]MCJ9748939.1 hypothetical protein [Neorhizobium sp. SHOUNA12A]